MIILDEKQKEELEELASRLMKPREIALIMGIDIETFRLELESPSDIYQCYHKGFLKTKAEINKSIVSHACAGSSPAQTLASRFITDIAIELDE